MACTQLSPCISLPLKREILEDIVDKAKDWALMHGKKMIVLVWEHHALNNQIFLCGKVFYSNTIIITFLM